MVENDNLSIRRYEKSAKRLLTYVQNYQSRVEKMVGTDGKEGILHKQNKAIFSVLFELAKKPNDDGLWDTLHGLSARKMRIFIIAQNWLSEFKSIVRKCKEEFGPLFKPEFMNYLDFIEALINNAYQKVLTLRKITYWDHALDSNKLIPYIINQMMKENEIYAEFEAEKIMEKSDKIRGAIESFKASKSETMLSTSLVINFYKDREHGSSNFSSLLSIVATIFMIPEIILDGFRNFVKGLTIDTSDVEKAMAIIRR